MDVFLNEDCLYKRDDINAEEIINFLQKNLQKFKGHDIKCFSDSNSLEQFFNDCNLSTQLNTLFLSLFKNTGTLRSTSRQYYYHYFTHQDFTLSIGENISNSCLSDAADKVLQNEIIAVLNIPLSHYCHRSIIPIIRSSYDSRKSDSLAILPCFNDSDQIIKFYLINSKLKPFIEASKFDEFCSNYYEVLKNFNHEQWYPLTYEAANKLDAKHAFPASTNDFLKTFFSNLKIEVGDYNENVSRYINLGTIVLNLHGYLKNNRLSSHYGHEIFEGGIGNKKLFVSLDTENGLFEVIDFSGTHIGVYNYAGTYQKHYTNQGDINRHSLLQLPTNLFLFD